MVRVHTFLGLVAVTFVGVKSLDSFVVWMAENREAKREQLELEKKAIQLRRQLIQSIHEKEAQWYPSPSVQDGRALDWNENIHREVKATHEYS
ncbi:hypothetical protein R1flu_022030 [Riccia fluitans]|uniref:Uncharacterized protein n=1 Tax=Riccia fluitans TaxID=41844 RepID=A0ABD1ZS73_9MARC